MTKKDNSINNGCKECKKYEETCECEKICICKYDKLSYNNKHCCYLQPKDICIVQVNDSKLFQIITNSQNIYLTAVPLEINTSSYEIESSSIQRPNDTLVINDPGVYSIYVSLRYSFKFNENANEGDILRISFKINGNDEEVFEMDNTIIVPKITEGHSEEIVNTIQRAKLKIIEENLPYKINIFLDEFKFDITFLNQITISDLVLIVEKVI